jgi:hypothetical protein
MYSAKDKHFRSFPIGTEVPSFADSKAESSSSQTHEYFQRGRNITYQILPSFHALTTLPLLFSELGKKYIYKILKTSPE